MSAQDIAIYIIVALICVLAVLFIIALRKLSAAIGRIDAPESVAASSRRCAPEVIDPRPRRRRGACGVLGCPNVRPHSHVADLMRRLKEPRQ